MSNLLGIRSILSLSNYKTPAITLGTLRDLPGAPDIVLPRYKCVVFVNGCFWHAHRNCPKFKIPSSNKAFWEKKLQENVNRDMKKSKVLRKLGYNVIVVWECQLKSKSQDSIKKVIRILNESKRTHSING